jgi:hypothetical protein
LIIRTATTSVVRASARAKPASRTTSPAIAVANEGVEVVEDTLKGA